MKKLYSIIVTLFLGFFVMQAQEISVQSFALAETDLTANTSGTMKLTPSLVPDFAEVSLVTDNGAEIYINGDLKGKGSWTGRLASGSYIFESRKAGHIPYKMSHDITRHDQFRTISIQAPTPVYGSLVVSSSPSGAKISINGQSVGQTPIYIANQVIGQYTLTAELDGYAKQTKKIEVVEGKETSCSFELINIESFNRIYDSDVMYSITINGTSYYMPFVDGGSFMMGSDDPEASSQDKPVHKVTISNYRIGKNLVSEGLWNAVMNPNDNPRIIYSKGNVSWDDCQEFIRRLNSLMGMNFQLPTEAQWEFAARMGIIDIEGSDSEWCSDWYGSYSSSSQTDPKGPSSGSQRVIRGGSAADDEGSSRVSCRLSASPGDRYRNVGFRLCLCL